MFRRYFVCYWASNVQQKAVVPVRPWEGKLDLEDMGIDTWVSTRGGKKVDRGKLIVETLEFPIGIQWDGVDMNRIKILIW